MTFVKPLIDFFLKQKKKTTNYSRRDAKITVNDVNTTINIIISLKRSPLKFEFFFLRYPGATRKLFKA